MSRAITVTIPLCPPQACSPNGGWHWKEKAAAKAQLRMAAKGAALNARWRYLGMFLGGAIFEGPVVVAPMICWGKGRRTVDGDNALAMLKAAIDGCTDASIWRDDRQCRFDPVTQGRDPDGLGFVRLEITEVVS